MVWGMRRKRKPIGANSTYTPKPKPNELIIPDNQGYAMTDIAICEAAEFLMTKLKSINLDDLDPFDRVCAICEEECHVSEGGKQSHAPVKTVCRHIFGKKCILKRLDPLCFWVDEDDEGSDADKNSPLFENAKSSCPICGRVFFPECMGESLDSLTARLCIWDSAYAGAGLARSKKEERTRKYLWEYANYCNSVREHQLDGRMTSEMHYGAHELLFRFSLSLKAQKLTPAQEKLREKLEWIGNWHLGYFEMDQETGVYIMDPDHYGQYDTSGNDFNESDSDESDSDESDSDESTSDESTSDESTSDDSNSDEIDNNETDGDFLPSQNQEPRPPVVAADGHHEWYLERVLDSRINRRRHNLLQYLIVWEGGEQTWEPWQNIGTNAAKALHDFHARYPAKPGRHRPVSVSRGRGAKSHLLYSANPVRHR